MGILSRGVDVLRSHMNALVDKFEDPTKMSNLVLSDIQRDISKAEGKLSNLIAKKNLIGDKMAKLQEAIDGRDAQIRDIVGSGVVYDDESKQLEAEALARELIENKQELETQLAELTAEYDQIAQVVEELKPTVVELKKKYQEFKRKRDIQIARDASAQAQLSVYETLGSIGETGRKRSSTFERMQEKVDAKHARAQAARELVNSNVETSLDHRVSSFTKRSVEDELARYKGTSAANE